MQLHVRRIEGVLDNLHGNVSFALGAVKWLQPGPLLRWELSLRLPTPEWVRRRDARENQSLVCYLRDLIEAEGGEPSKLLSTNDMLAADDHIRKANLYTAQATRVEETS